MTPQVRAVLATGPRRFGPSWTADGAFWQVETKTGSNRVWLGDAEYPSIAAAITAARMTFSRASQKYALNAAGQFVSFASGALAMTDAGLSLEAAATNLVIRSTDMSHADWSKTACTAVGGQADPFGGNNAYLITESGSSADLRCAVAITVVSATEYVACILIKPGNCQWIRIGMSDSAAFTNRVRQWFDLTNGALGVSAAAGSGFTAQDKSIHAIGGGYYLLTFAMNVTGTSLFIDISSAASNGSSTKANVGGGTGIGCTYTIAHMQVETDTTTSPIVTTGAAATRPADALVIKPVAGAYTITYNYSTGEAAGITTGTAITVGGYTVNSVSNWSSTKNGRQFASLVAV